MALFLLPLLPLASALLSADDASKCDCFSTESSTSSLLFTHHTLFDFRHLSSYVPTDPQVVDPATGTPHLVDDPDLASFADLTSPYFDEEPWSSTWGIQSWNNSYPNAQNGDATVLMVHSKNNVYIERHIEPHTVDEGDTFLTLRTARHDDFQSTAEFESVNQDYHFLSMRMFARVTGDDGACASMFTYLPGSDPVQEADVEFLTAGPRNRAQYTNQPGSTASTKNATMPVQMSEWAMHRLDWTDNKTQWFVNDDLVAEINVQAPVDPAMLILNAWSDGGSWAGKMAVGGVAKLQLQWLEVAYNVTEGSKRRSEGGCTATCNVDAEVDDGADGSAAGRALARWALVVQAVLVGAWFMV